MIYEKELRELISKWGERIQSRQYDTSYNEGLSDCMYELSKLIEQYHTQESVECDPFNQMTNEELKDYYENLVVDNYPVEQYY